MDFDTEVMVRLYWQGNTSYFVPTRVTYPLDGLSHFDALKDNIRISLMHTRLLFRQFAAYPFAAVSSPPLTLGKAAGSERAMGNADHADRLAIPWTPCTFHCCSDRWWRFTG